MLRPALVASLGIYLLVSPGLWDQQRAAVILAIIGGSLLIIFALVSPVYARALDLAALVGFIVCVSAFLVTERPFTDGNRGAVGVFAMMCAIAPRVRRLASGEVGH